MYMTKRIGNTTYRVKVVLSESGTQSLEDRLLRLIRNDPLAIGDHCGIMDSPQKDHPQRERMIP
ncbi:MAG: transposon-encoded TnpW family protein [Clostridia bacterium]|nr:transposon-encoded TnpW family protein [Clostridia bacterium]